MSHQPTGSAPTPTVSHGSPRLLAALRISAILMAVIAVVQAVLAVVFLTGGADLKEVHGILGMLLLPVAVVATMAAWRRIRDGGNPGLAGHAAGMLVMAVIQIGLGELHIRTMHISLGVAFVVGAAALAFLAYRRPDAA